MKFNKFFSNFDYTLFFSTLVLTVVGILFIYSANLNKSADQQTQYLKQIIFAFMGLIFLISILFLQEKNILDYSLIFYIICIIGLIITLFFPEIRGTRRLQISFISIQFKKFMKIASIGFLSKFYSEKTSEELRKLITYLKSLVIIIIPIFLILLQPDLGTTLVYIPIILFISFFAGVKKIFHLYNIADYFYYIYTSFYFS